MSLHRPLDLVVLGLSITSSWGNGHATTWRGLLREFAARGHRVCFLERDVPWYAAHRDLPDPSFCRTALYGSVEQLREEHAGTIRAADVVIVGSYVPDGVDVGRWVTDTATGPVAFYDIDTPVTLARLARGDHEYIDPPLVARYDAYFSFTGGPTLAFIERELGSPMARALYCSVDTAVHGPEERPARWDLGYMGTYSEDRQPPLEQLLLEPARRWPEGRFCVAGPQYPEGVQWPDNVQRIEHLPPARHREFYTSQRFTLNITRADMIEAGWSPSVRLFEAAACGAPIISDWWEGLDTIFRPGEEVLIARSAHEALLHVRNTPEEVRRRIAARARNRVLSAHTGAHRAGELESYALTMLERAAAEVH
jgi:spore maturation protein CgeB